MTVLLILSVGSLVGTNILDAVEAFRPDLRVIGINSEAEALNNFRCDRVFLAPPAHQAEAYWQRGMYRLPRRSRRMLAPHAPTVWPGWPSSTVP